MICLNFYILCWVYFYFIYFYSYFLFLLLFYFLDNEEACDYGHMTRSHKHRTLWKELEGIILRYMSIAYCYMPSLSVQKIYSYGDTVLSTSNLKAHLLWQLTFLQHALILLMQWSGDSVFYDRDTSI